MESNPPQLKAYKKIINTLQSDDLNKKRLFFLEGSYIILNK